MVGHGLTRGVMMSVITFRTKYLSATNSAGVRVKVTASVEDSCTRATLVVAWDYALDDAWNHRRAARQLAWCLGVPELEATRAEDLRDGYRWRALAPRHLGPGPESAGRWRVAQCTRPGCTRIAPGETVGMMHTCDRCAAHAHADGFGSRA